MEEAVLERVEKEEAEKRWEQYHNGGDGMPTEKQKAYIIALARNVGLMVNVEKIADRQRAGELIQKLQRIRGQMNGKSLEAELRDKRVSYGMATKLVFKKYVDRHQEVRRSKKFWQEVGELYREYQQHQEAAILEAAEGA